MIDLLDEEGRWCEQKVYEVFTKDGAEMILNIPTSNGKARDEIIWNKDPKGHQI